MILNQSQRALAQFLAIDLVTAFTFLKIAHTTRNEDHAKRATRSAQNAANTIQLYIERVQGAEIRRRLTVRADELHSAIECVVAATRTQS